MATLAQVSLYAANSMKLEQEKNEKEEIIKEGSARFAEGKPPTLEAEQGWIRDENIRIIRERDRQKKMYELVEVNNLIF